MEPLRAIVNEENKKRPVLLDRTALFADIALPRFSPEGRYYLDMLYEVLTNLQVTGPLKIPLYRDVTRTCCIRS